jgi:hypothetical protein
LSQHRAIMPSATYSTLRNAILNTLTVTADYRGHSRVFCPHAIGMKRDREHCLGFQFAGGSSSGLPSGGEWRCFDVNGLASIFTGSGPWHTGANHTQPQSCVDIIDAEVSY